MKEQATRLLPWFDSQHFAVWLMTKYGIDFGQQYTDLGEERQRELVTEAEKENETRARNFGGGSEDGL